MSQQSDDNDERGAAEEASGVPDTPEEHDASPATASTGGDRDFRADGAAEEATGVEEDQ
jgi:hypothetical protein